MLTAAAIADLASLITMASSAVQFSVSCSISQFNRQALGTPGTACALRCLISLEMLALRLSPSMKRREMYDGRIDLAGMHMLSRNGSNQSADWTVEFRAGALDDAHRQLIYSTLSAHGRAPSSGNEFFSDESWPFSGGQWGAEARD